MIVDANTRPHHLLPVLCAHGAHTLLRSQGFSSAHAQAILADVSLFTYAPLLL